MVSKQAPPKRGATQEALTRRPGRKIGNKHQHSPAAITASASNEATEQARVMALDERVSALRARARLSGWLLHVAPSGGFLACRWGRVHELPTLTDFEAFLKRLGGRHA